MDSINVFSEDVFFLSGIKSVLHKLSKNIDSSFSHDVIITDSIDQLNQLSRKSLQSTLIILFVKNLQHSSIINHFSFQQSFAILTMEDTVEDIEESLKHVFCKLRRRLHITHTSSFTDQQVWLTARELDVLMLSCTERDINNISSKIRISPKSVLNYRAAALKKMGVNLSASLVSFIRSLHRFNRISTTAYQN